MTKKEYREEFPGVPGNLVQGSQRCTKPAAKLGDVSVSHTVLFVKTLKRSRREAETWHHVAET